MKTYRGARTIDGIQVTVNGQPLDERVDLHQAVLGVPLDNGQCRAGRGVDPAGAGDPCVVALERAIQRRYLAQGAAQVGVAVVQAGGTPGDPGV